MDVINKCLNDPRISWKAKGILVYLSNNSSIVFDKLLEVSKDRRTALQNGLQELKLGGYLDRFAIRDDFGKINFYLNIPIGYKLNEEEVQRISNKEIIAYYYKTKERFPSSYNDILINVMGEIRKRNIDIKHKNIKQIVMDSK